MWLYNNYLTVSEDFIPVFSEDVDNNKKDNWKFFIPHIYMRDVLDKLVRALERSHSKDKLSIWLTGAYGTGKTYAAFVIKHLLEDPLEEVENYLLKYEMVSPLWPRFKALRNKNPFLVVYRSSSGQITTNRRLMIELQEAIKEKLKAQGYKSAFGEGIMDCLITKLDDTRGILNWNNIFNQYRGRFRTVGSAEELIKRLHGGDMQLGEQVAEILEEEGQTLLDSPSDIKDWIRQVIEVNNLQGLVFIWDEFTEFFTNNVPVTPLQELAHSSADMPFYLFLITHRAIQQFTRIDDDTRRKLMERFHPCRLEMTPVTAYKLIGNVIEANSSLRDDWEAKRESLWNKVDAAVLHINMLGEPVKKEELKLLPPIHPFTAYILATISSLYSSSQRTFFRFLKEKEEGSFQWFVANFPQGNWYWLTPDYLWQYFFEKMKIEDVEAIADVLSHYNAVKEQLDVDQIRVFRVMMLLTALQQQIGDGHTHTLLKPRLSFTRLMFLGTALYDQVGEIADQLLSKNIMLGVRSGNDLEYMIPRVTIDQDKMRQYEQQAKANLTMEKMIERGKMDEGFASQLKELMLLQGAAELRHPVQLVSGKQLKYRRERAIQGKLNPYQIGIIFVVAEEDDHLIDTESIAVEITQIYPNYCIFISQRPFGSKKWSEWVESKAKSWYYLEMHDTNMKKYYDTRANNIVIEWLETVRISQIRAFFQGKQEELVGCQAITSYLFDLVGNVFPDGPEKINRTATLYTNPWGKAGAEIGLQIAASVHRPYKDVVDELDNRGLWENSDFVSDSSYPVVKMKRKVDCIFAEQNSVNINELWLTMQKPPYGLMPSPIGILLLSFLLKDYAMGYYYYDGFNSLALNPHKLAELVNGVLKGTGSFEAYAIRKMSTEGEEFCRMARDIFHLSPEQTAYPEEARKSMINAVIELGYPLWTINYYNKKGDPPSRGRNMLDAVRLLSNTLVYDRNELSDSEMKAIVDVVGSESYQIKKFINRGSMQQGMNGFWELHAPELQVLASGLGLEATEVMARLRLLLNEDVNMWDENRVKEKLPAIIKELDLIDAMNKLCQTNKKDLDTIRDYFRGTWFNSKLPLLCYKEGQPDGVVELIDYIYRLVNDSNQATIENRAEEIRIFKDQLLEAFQANTAVIKVLSERFAGQSISDEEAARLYKDLPNLSMASDDKVKENILYYLSQQVRQKKITLLQKEWEKHTKTSSPASWSEHSRVPIQWVLDGHAYHTFFTQYSRIKQLSENEIDEVIAYLRNHSSELSVLKDREHILGRFIEVTAGDYAGLIKQSNSMDIVRDYVYKAVGGKVYEWPRRLSEVTEKVRQWVHDNYHSSTYPKLIKMIENMSSNDMKGFIKDLVSKDALVGVRLLAAIQDNS
ncbi:MAG: hypothetical protein GX334_03760 [Firmicutes bacterium]|nr:hypothetical protein [Bacillota bacterium]